MKVRSLVLAAAFVMAPLATASAAIVNGGFEDGINAGGFTPIAGGDNTSITGWTVGGNSVDYIGTYWQNNGNSGNSIDLSGNGPGWIEQAISVIDGQQYKVTFYLAGNPDGPPPVKPVNVYIDGVLNYAPTFTLGSSTRAQMNWLEYSFVYTASGTTDVLRFESTSGSAYGAALDDVSIAAVPEASTWLMMLLGFVGVGFASYRQRQIRKTRFA